MARDPYKPITVADLAVEYSLGFEGNGQENGQENGEEEAGRWGHVLSYSNRDRDRVACEEDVGRCRRCREERLRGEER